MSMMNSIVLAAGGTGGHIFPAEALASELTARGHAVALFTDSRGQAFSADVAAPVVRIKGRTPSGVKMIQRVQALGEIAQGVWQARQQLQAHQAKLVVGFGGYASVPTILAAASLRLPIILHEQNAVLGRANKLLAPFADKIATCFLRVQGMGRYLHKITLTGNPVRAGFVAARDVPYPTLNMQTPLRILVTGGSQGAKVFGQILPEALKRLPAAYRARLQLQQQCRSEDIPQVRAVYDSLGLAAELAPFLTNMPERLAQAHLLIGRGGASTVAELTCVGRPGILVPYPYALGDEQSANAEALSAHHAAWLMPEAAFTPDSIAVRLEAFLNLPDTLIRTAQEARAQGHPQAAQNLANLVLKA